MLAGRGTHAGPRAESRPGSGAGPCDTGASNPGAGDPGSGCAGNGGCAAAQGGQGTQGNPPLSRGVYGHVHGHVVA
eukprot:257071-Chlamydomonas_euryale.AAC.1